MLTNTKDTFGAISRFTHWFVLILFLMVTLGGLRASELEKGAEKLDMIFMHKSVGVMILTLMLFRVVWKLSNPTPVALSSDIKNIRLSKFIQFLLMVLLIAQPVVGVLMSQASGHAVSPFGFFDLPTLVAEDASLAETMKKIHGRLWIAIVGLTLAHLAGSLKQHYILKNRTLLRMLKG